MRARSVTNTLLRGGLGAVVVGAFLLATPVPQPQAQAAAEAIPDLQVAPLDNFQIQWVGGRRLLRFTAMMVNTGAGHFEVRGSRSSTSDPMRMRQVIYTDSTRSTVSRQILTDAVGKWSGDGHDHWHVQEMMRYDMWGSTGNLRGAKVGFCFLDSDPYKLSLPGAAQSFYYRGSWCQTTPSALSNRMGISVGWADEYEWYLAWQWVDITDWPGGTYTVRSKVDPYGFFLEESETNNCAWATISFNGTSGSVSVKQRGTGCIDDWSGSKFVNDIQWAFDNDITTGCGLDLFCPNRTVTRAQMASFLARALDLPPASTDYFTDDNGSVHEGNINRIAAAGLTSGCGSGHFCPDGVVTRGQMATFLSRAFDLPPASSDYFTDDAGNKHEANINRIAEAGITHGCTATTFCPDGATTRGQMVALLHRALRD